MAIGPEADHQISGRVLVIASALLGTGLMALILGAGPIVEGAAPLTAVAGAVAMLSGGIMVIGGAGLLWRGSTGRQLGVAGALAGMVLSLVLTAAALASLAGQSGATGDGGNSSEPVVIGIAGIGLLGYVLAFGSMRVIKQVPGRYWHRGGR